MKKQIFLIMGIVFSMFAFSNVLAANDLEIQDFHLSGSKMIFKTSVPSQSILIYDSEDKEVHVDLNDPVYRQSHDIQLWNLQFFTRFDYTLIVKDYQGNQVTRVGAFTVTPADPDLYIELMPKEEEEIAVEDMTREQLIEYLKELLNK
jgi:hypothetical protein